MKLIIAVLCFVNWVNSQKQFFKCNLYMSMETLGPSHSSILCILISSVLLLVTQKSSYCVILKDDSVPNDRRVERKACWRSCERGCTGLCFAAVFLGVFFGASDIDTWHTTEIYKPWAGVVRMFFLIFISCISYLSSFDRDHKIQW